MSQNYPYWYAVMMRCIDVDLTIDVFLLHRIIDHYQ